MKKIAMNIPKKTTLGQIVLTYFFCFALVLVLGTLDLGINPVSWADNVNHGNTVTIITPGTEARLCPQPACGPDQHISRIPKGTVFTIQNTEVFAIGTFKVKWFEVIYENQRGWISIYDTDQAHK